MKFPVYRFSEVLRALRNESGLTVLQAAELTRYGNYERWESGDTRVRPEYLQTIAEVFGIDGDLWLLVYGRLTMTRYGRGAQRSEIRGRGHQRPPKELCVAET